MPNYKGHLVGGACIYAISLYLVMLFLVPIISFSLGIEWLLFTLAGALFPDIDVKSKGQKYFYWIILSLALLLLLKGRLEIALAVSILSLVPMLIKHRGLFHRAWFIMLLTGVSSFLLVMYFPACHRTICYDALFFMIGALSHLWLDLGIRGLFRR